MSNVIDNNFDMVLTFPAFDFFSFEGESKTSVSSSPESQSIIDPVSSVAVNVSGIVNRVAWICWDDWVFELDGPVTLFFLGEGDGQTATDLVTFFPSRLQSTTTSSYSTAASLRFFPDLDDFSFSEALLLPMTAEW
jgi:hypothetical protein